jgi:acetyl esterase
MPLDPSVQTLLDLAPPDLPPYETLTPDEARALYRATRLPSAPPEPVAETEDRTVAGAAGEIPVRVYTPEGNAPLPVLMYFHGGGWVIGDIETHDALCRSLANRARCVVVSVQYRLAPEHKFPAQLDDCFAATAYVARHAAEFGADAGRLAVVGDSAGGNLAAAVTLMARDRGGPAIVHQVLIYPVTNFDFGTPSYSENATGYLLTEPLMRWFWDHYLPDPADGADPHASPLRAESLAGLPSALVVTAEYDPLRDEGEAYAARLSAAGVPVVMSRYDGMVHSFVSLAALLPAGDRAITEVATALRAAFTAVASRA